MHPSFLLFSATLLSNVNYYYNPFEMSQKQLDSISYSVSTLNAVYTLHSFFQMEAMKTAFIFEKSEMLKSFLKEKRQLIDGLNQNLYDIFKKMTENPESLKDIIKPNFFEKLFAIYESPEAIKYIKYPSQLLQKLAISLDITSVQYIKNMDLKIKIDAIKELLNQGYDIVKWIKKIQ